MCKYCEMVRSVDYGEFATVGEKDLENEFFNCDGKQEGYDVNAFLIKHTGEDIALDVSIYDKDFIPLNIDIAINYCPMCGRALNSATTSDINPDIRKIAEHYGAEPQMNKAVEELYELIYAVIGYEANPCPETKLALIDEIADVTVMIEQLRYFADISRGEVNERVRFKVERTLGRIAEDKKNG